MCMYCTNKDSGEKITKQGQEGKGKSTEESNEERRNTNKIKIKRG